MTEVVRVPVPDDGYPDAGDFARWCQRIGEAGYRGTGSAAHHELIDWIEAEVRSLGLEVRCDAFPILRWQPVPEGDLVAAGELWVDGDPVPVGGAVPYSLPGTATGPLARIPGGVPITAENAAGRIVVRDFPSLPIPYDLLLDPALHATGDLAALRGQIWDRPGLADSILHRDLLDAGAAGAAGVVIAFDLPRHQIAGYHEPHKGTHYALPAVFVGADERERLPADGTPATVGVRADVAVVETTNLHVTIPGGRAERAVLVTHTDGNTWVQENGIAALLAIATVEAARPATERARPIELVFSSAHLHISREGAWRHAAHLDATYDVDPVAYALPIEHVGVRALEPVDRVDGPGRELVFSGDPELVMWSAGPSDALRAAVRQSIDARGLERTVLVPGLGAPVPGQVPEIVSFGGLGTLYNLHLLPTTSVLTGPWSLWTPSFGATAIDIDAVRQHTLAVHDVVRTLDALPLEVIAGRYLDQRAARAAGAPVGHEPVPPELAPHHPAHPTATSAT